MSDHTHHHPAPAHEHGHGHDAHGHGHGHGHGHDDFAAANKAYFDEHADKLEEMHPEWREMSRKQVDTMRAEWPELFDKEHTEVLDFACGIGLVSEPLSQYVKSIVGVDISPVSVDRYNAQAARLGLSPEKMKAVCVELKGEPGELDGAKFDIVVCCASYHHFASIDDITRTLVSFLKPGGSLLVADIKAEADNRELFPESHHGMVPHTHGIAEARLRETFEGAGLAAFVMKDAAKMDMKQWGMEGKETTWFIARGVKQA
ncbi:S-adenosyl-L-methionine-dependent methyltransferase [Lentinus tigrinus ALCF2SS1-7]|uniref:S-adenosyl-L-methionine-dependent methyltransferase n=1 Tax=Lentinus tigrinus ALCF2SS1-6 TaxID=1328759 RepID=A0A5C2RXA4_9APHY|nr:S-adenosyl-L-methionine-dependent methyltransferase [Lentinus tigrinus ALCF2SS1-6]RPD69083.1 S-adenosyl-L-methionine-dependent methyltransferase [Lentinus tigrinus ALCF2SS1-7]